MMVKSAQQYEDGGARPPPFTLSAITSKVVVYAPAERADTLTTLPLHVLCDADYQPPLPPPIHCFSTSSNVKRPVPYTLHPIHTQSVRRIIFEWPPMEDMTFGHYWRPFLFLILHSA